jgi:predicted transposase YdaD
MGHFVSNITVTLQEMEEAAIARGLQRGLEQGIERGIERGKRATAIALLDILDDEMISLKVGIPLAEVKELRATHIGEHN